MLLPKQCSQHPFPFPRAAIPDAPVRVPPPNLCFPHSLPFPHAAILKSPTSHSHQHKHAAVNFQACGLAVKRYPGAAGGQVAQEGSHAWAAARVIEGEKAVLTAVKRAALLLMAEAAGDEDEDDEEEEEEEDVEEEEEEEKEEEAQRGKRRRPGLGAGREGGGGTQKKAKGQAGGKGERVRRPHYGNLTGPPEQDLLSEEDSDKVGLPADGLVMCILG